jgi:hypothetical protein
MTSESALRELLCEQWCSEAVITQDASGTRLSLPVYEADGDAVTVWLKPSLGGWVVSDMGTTLMRISYDMDIDLLQTGQRARVLETILAETGIRSQEGTLLTQVAEGELVSALLAFGQAIARIGDIKLWSKTRVASTFYDDLGIELARIVGAGQIYKDYVVPDLENGEDYPVDFYLSGGSRPLYVFGVPSGDKAKLATIVLQRLAAAGLQFESLVVPADIATLPQRDLRRLMNAANDMVDSLTAREALERKIRHRLAA